MATQLDTDVANSLNDATLDQITRHLAKTAERYDRAGEFPQAAFDILARQGLIGLTVSRDLGGQGAGYVDTLRVLGAVAKGDPSAALILFMTYAFHAGEAKGGRWPAAVYKKLAREALAGRGLIGTFRVEPELGTPVRGGLPKTTARQTADGWRIVGEKIYSTGSTGLDWFAVWARTNEAEPRVGLFLIDSSSPGITIVPEWDHLGMRATVSHRVVFDDTLAPTSAAVDVRRPEEWVLPTGQANGPVLWNALAIAAIYDGVARAARDWLAGYLNDRAPANLGAPLATLPRVQEKFGEIEALLQVNRTLIFSAAQAADRGELPSADSANIVKHVATTNAIQAVAIGLELTGNPGISRNHPLERHYRDVLCSRIHSPQADTILIGAGRAGLSR